MKAPDLNFSPKGLYIGGKWRFRDDIMLVPAVDAQTKAKVAQREFI